MSRICIFSFYDAEGNADEYVYFYLKSLIEVVNKLIIVINGQINEDDLERMNSFTKDIVIRENKGFDAGAYKEVIELYGKTYFTEFAELVLANDTCFGPFVPFKDIFEKMRKKECDFWGISYSEAGYSSCIQSYFLVFRKKCIETVEQYLTELVLAELMTKGDVCIKFETGLFWELVRACFKFGYYLKLKANPYEYPDTLLDEYDFPFIKKLCFLNEMILPSCERAINIVSEKYGYNTELIRNVIPRIRKRGVFSQTPSGVSTEAIEYIDILNFCKKNKEIYIYGAGGLGRKVAWLFRYCDNISGFIVTDLKNNEKEVYGLKVYEIADIMDKEVGIIVALNKEHTRQIRNRIRNFPNVLYLRKEND